MSVRQHPKVQVSMSGRLHVVVWSCGRLLHVTGSLLAAEAPSAEDPMSVSPHQNGEKGDSTRLRDVGPATQMCSSTLPAHLLRAGCEEVSPCRPCQQQHCY